MPTYEYRCVSCEHQFERFQRMSDEPVKECEVCGEPVKRLLFPVAIQFKGSGFYTTDYARKSTLGSPGSHAANGADSSSRESSGDSSSSGDSRGSSSDSSSDSSSSDGSKSSDAAPRESRAGSGPAASESKPPVTSVAGSNRG